MKKDYPLRLCSTCAAEYASGGFRVLFARPKYMIVNQQCSFCQRSVPVYACRIEGGKRRKTAKQKAGGL